MPPSPKPDPTLYSPIPPSEPNSEPQTYILLPLYPHPNHHRLRTYTLLSLTLLLLTSTLYLLYPSEPDLRLVRVRLNHIAIHALPHPTLALSLALSLRVRNRDFFSLSYNGLAVSISYRGRELGVVGSDGGEVKARRSSYVNATLVVDGVQVIKDFVYLVEDLAAGSVPFDTVSQVNGHLALFFIKIPIKAKVSCEVDINPKNQKIIHQNCYPE